MKNIPSLYYSSKYFINLMFFAILLFIFITPSHAFAFDFFKNLNRVGEINNEIEILKNENEIIKKEISNIKKDADFYKALYAYILNETNRLSKIFPEIASISPSDKGYTIVSCKNGYFAVSCKNIRSYSTGSEFIIEIVNMLSVPLADVKLKVVYANTKRFDENEENLNLNFEDSKKTNVEKIPNPVQPAIATHVTIRAPEYKPDQIKTIEISISAGGILYK